MYSFNGLQGKRGKPISAPVELTSSFKITVEDAENLLRLSDKFDIEALREDLNVSAISSIYTDSLSVAIAIGWITARSAARMGSG